MLICMNIKQLKINIFKKFNILYLFIYYYFIIIIILIQY